MPKVVITMPAYNAEATLARTVADIPPGVADQLILVDDASPDNTATLARELGIDVHVHAENRGYGENQKTCYTMALAQGADIVVMLHPDYQYEPKAVPLLIAPILAGDADMTFGSRFAGLGDPRAGGMPLYRYLGNRVTTTAENVLLGSRFTEMHSGMRAYTRRCLLSLPFLRYSGDFAFDSQFLVDAVTGGQRVIEVPIPTRYTNESSSIGTLQSLSYIAKTLGYCVSRVVSHGRKRRSPIGWREAPVTPLAEASPTGSRQCVLCGTSRAYLELSDGSIRCGTCGLVVPGEHTARVGGLSARTDAGSEPSRPALRDWMTAELEGYALTGGRMLEVAESHAIHQPAADAEARARGAHVELTTPLDDSVNTILLSALNEPALRALGGLVGIRRLLYPEGMLAAVLNLSRSAAASPGTWPDGVRADTLERALHEAGLQLVEMKRLPGRVAAAHAQVLESSGRPTSATKPSLVLARAGTRSIGA